MFDQLHCRSYGNDQVSVTAVFVFLQVCTYFVNVWTSVCMWVIQIHAKVSQLGKHKSYAKLEWDKGSTVSDQSSDVEYYFCLFNQQHAQAVLCIDYYSLIYEFIIMHLLYIYVFFLLFFVSIYRLIQKQL